jgi:hypothetical protein
MNRRARSALSKFGLVPCLPELNPEPVLLPPYHTATPPYLTGIHDQPEVGGNRYRIWNVKRGAGL